MKLCRFSLAAQHYSSGLARRNRWPVLNTNRAIAYLKLKQVAKCAEDCAAVGDIVDSLEEHQSRSDVVFNAFLRRAQARQLLEEQNAAKRDIEAAIELRQKQRDARKLKNVAFV